MSIACANKNHQVDNIKCYTQWPSYPCYDSAQRACYNQAGTEQLFDPFSDILYGASVLYLKAADLLEKLWGIAPTPSRRDAEARVAHFIHDYATTAFPLRNPALYYADYARYQNPEQIQAQLEAVSEALGKVATTPQPPQLRRADSEEKIGGRRKRRKTHKKRRRRRRKSKRKL